MLMWSKALWSSILEPAHTRDRTWACGLVLPGLCRVALLRLNFAVEGLTRSPLRLLQGSSWLSAFLLLRTSSRGATRPQVLVSAAPPSATFAQLSEGLHDHRSCLGRITLNSAHMAIAIFASTSFMWNLLMTRTAVGPPTDHPADHLSRIWCAQPNFPKVSMVNVQVAQRWSHEF